MKIHSNFKDYYDIGLKYLIDDEPVFIRNEIRVKLESGAYIHKLNNVPLHFGMIFFCGEYHPFARMNNSIHHTEFDTFYSTSQFTSKHLIKTTQVLDSLFNPDFHMMWRKSDDNTYNTLKRQLDSFRENHPIAVLEYSIRTCIEMTNCNLKQFEFQKIIDPFTAIHKLNTFLCNQARPENPVVNISDKDLAKSKGYDKFSFRKDKTKRNSK